MIVSFLSPTTPHPIGGVAVIFELANALVARGHTAQILHHGIFGSSVDGLDDIGWFDFDPDVRHWFTGLEDPDDDEIPSADIFFGHAPEGRAQPRYGLPVVLIQGFGMLGEQVEAYAFEAPCPKVCVAKWLIEVGTDRFDMPPTLFEHVAPGLDLNRFSVRTPIEDRSPCVSFLHSNHPRKGTHIAVQALGELRDEFPDLRVRAFGSAPPQVALPDWIEHRLLPQRDELIDDIYNHSSIFLCASDLEGFGLPLVEAMACGAALVTTENGGAGDYAIHEETALVAPRGDVSTLAAHMKTLLDDDSERRRLAVAGHEFVQRYQWSAAAEKLERFLLKYLADPAALSLPDDYEPSVAERTNYR